MLSDLLERSKEVPMDVVVVHKADQVVALLNLNENRENGLDQISKR